jgi:transposase
MAEALSAFAAHADPGGRKVPVLVVDRAGWHTAGRLIVPANVRLHFLPPCTPELQPVEALRPLIREATANEGYDDLSALERPLIERCGWLMDHFAVVRGAVGFGWATANG